MSSKPNVKISGSALRRPKLLRRLDIQTIEHLALQLGSSQDELLKFAASPRAFRTGFFFDKKGKQRPKAEPLGRLKPILKRLNAILQRLDLPLAMHGGRAGCSNLTNAQPHRIKDVVLTFDIKGFFPSISHQDVFDIFHHRCGCKPEIARLLASLTTHNDQLAQGSPPSTIIAALVAEPLIKRIETLVRLHGGEVTLYVDDIAVSGPSRLREFKQRIIDIITQEGFESHADKVHVRSRDEEQIVTGVKVNDQLDVSGDRIGLLRGQVRKLEKLIESNELLSPQEVGDLVGKLGYLSRLNRGAAKHYRKRIGRMEEYLQRTQNLARSPAT